VGDAPDHYVRAAGRHAPLAVYDRVLAATMREPAWRPALAARVLAAVPPGGRVLEVGAGTGSLAIGLATARPDVAVTGVDGDPAALAEAAAKQGGAQVAWVEGDARALPLEDGSVAAVVMSLLLHHLLPEGQRAALAEARRVLEPGGQLHVADFGRAQDPLMALAFSVLRLTDGRANTAPHAAGRLPDMIAAAGFTRPERWRRLRTGFGTLELMSAAAA
jgi:ubiquinone/menaquinone biosynthesis C-methylase UbiE